VLFIPAFNNSAALIYLKRPLLARYNPIRKECSDRLTPNARVWLLNLSLLHGAQRVQNSLFLLRVQLVIVITLV
jgi:hypothetical protein